MANKKEINVLVSGQDRSGNLRDKKPNQYSVAINMNKQNTSGDTMILSTEASNILSVKFEEGFYVVGFKNDITTDKTYFFLTNPTTLTSEFGCIIDNQTLPNLGDTGNILNTPLENTVQQPSQQYITLLQDDCNKCLNLSILHPIKENNIVIKNEKCGNVLYFTDDFNPPRYIELDNMEIYSYFGDINCGEDNRVVTCMNCDRLKVFKSHKEAIITPTEIVLGGKLKKGTYEFIGAYCDNRGNEMSEYFSLTNTVHIFDKNNNIIENAQIADQTNFAIKLDVSNIDKNFTHYKIVVIQTASIDGATRYFEEGVHPVTDTSVLYDTEQGKTETTINKLFLAIPDIKTLEGLTTSNNYLIGYGKKVENEVNLQPVVNLLGGFLKWQTHITTEEYYENGIHEKGYHRDEVEPFSIRFKFNNGKTTAIFPFIARPATEYDREVVDNMDVQSINNSKGTCNASIRTQRWQYYNTAEQEEDCVLEGTIELVQQQEVEEIVTIVPSENNLPREHEQADPTIPSITNGTIIVNELDAFDFEDLATYIEEKKITCGSILSPIATICNALDPSNYNNLNNPPDLDSTCSEPENVLNEVGIVSVQGELYNFIPKALENYSRVRPVQSCSVHISNKDAQDGNNEDVDLDFSSQYAIRYDSTNQGVEGTLIKRTNVIYADTCISSMDLQHVTPDTIALNTLQSIIHPYFGAELGPVGDYYQNIVEDKNALYEDTYDAGQVGGLSPLNPFIDPPVIGVSGIFTDKIHKGALWFRIDIENKEKVIVEVSKLLEASTTRWRLGGSGIKRFRNRFIRAHFFTDCFSQDPIQQTTYENENEQQVTEPLGGIFELSSTPSLMVLGPDVIESSLDKKYLYMVVDLPISSSKGYGRNNYQDDEPTPAVIDTLVTIPLNSCFTINTREEEYKEIEVTYDRIDIEKVQKWITVCNYDVPVVDQCSLIPNKMGKFAYWESIETYPDNTELYDSSVLNISQDDFYSNDVSSYFEGMYADQVVSGNYTLKTDTNFTCKPIRHPKFPDNTVSPFMYEKKQAGFTPSIVYPLGVTIDEKVINDFLNIAVKNSLITQEKRDSITGYEIFKGDRTLSKSIVAKGVLFDMYSYKEGLKDILYSNYPYNDLGNDELNYDQSRNDFIEHPENGERNHNYTFHSPDSDYLRPTPGTEMKVETFIFGNSRGQFDEVDGHSKMTILGPQARRLASKLATAEVIAEAAINIAQSAEVYRIQVGLANSFNPVGIFLNIVVIVLSIISSVAFKYGRYKYEWLTTFRNLGQPENFAYYYSSEGYYNYIRNFQQEGDILRSINLSNYLKDGRKILVDKTAGKRLEINNYNREESLFITTGEEYPINYPIQYSSFDNSSINRSSGSRTYLSNGLNISSGRSPEVTKNIASPYVSIKNYIASQYGTIDSVKWLTTSYSGDLNDPQTSCLPIYGGDIFITRHTLKRKIPLFLRDAYGVAPLTPFNYSNYGNIGSPRFYVDYQVSDEVKIDRGFPDIRSDFNFDSSTNSAGFYIKPPSKFYLYYYGIPNFLCESEVNTNYRHAKKQPEENFYPNVGDHMDWTQQKVVPLKERNRFFYNFTYSKNVTPSLSRILPSTYNKEEWDCRYDEPNGGIYSLQDNSENDFNDPWLTFLPLNKFSFSSSNGKLVDMRGIENEQVMVRFTDNLLVHNAVDQTIDDGSRPETQVLGNGGLFVRRPKTFSETDLGKWGSQSSDMSSNEFGHFYVDAQRGTITQLMPSSQGIREISKVGSQNTPNGMFNWFKEHIPFKILKSNIQGSESIDTDNPYNGVGYTIGYDDRFKRVLFTKKDYSPVIQGIVHENGVFTYNEQPIKLNDQQYFQDISWTIAYLPLEQSWLSYYDYKPNYYISHNNYFQTGMNSDDNRSGLWSHNLTNKSYRVFYGTAFQSEVTYVTKNDLTGTLLNNIAFKSNAKRYHNEYDYAYDREITWNKAIISSVRECSGLLELTPQKSIYDLTVYPIQKQNSQEIPITNTNELWSFDYFFNRTFSENNNRPQFIKDVNDIEKTVNPLAVGFGGKPVLERMSETAFEVNLKYDGDTRYEVDLQWAINEDGN